MTHNGICRLKIMHMKSFSLTIALISSFFSFGQNLVFHTSLNEPSTVSSQYYSAMNFSKMDSLYYWKYQLDTRYHGMKTDTVKPIGQITFWRTKPIKDSREKTYSKFWTPHITFDIFTISDANYCFQYSKNIRTISSCTPPSTGGDVIVVGQFLLLNRSVCVNCRNQDAKIDYCRPIVNYLFSNIHNKKVETIEKLVEQFGITSGQFMEK